jgi:hypothetical protein
MLRWVLLASCAALASCATVTRGTRTDFVVETQPSGAQVELSTGETCNATPCTFPRIKRNSEFSVTISMDGYQTSTHEIDNRMRNGGTMGLAGNAVVGGLIGMAVDVGSGATQDLVPNPLVVQLNPIEAPAVVASTPDAATITDAAAAPVEEAAAAPVEGTAAASAGN